MSACPSSKTISMWATHMLCIRFKSCCFHLGTQVGQGLWIDLKLTDKPKDLDHQEKTWMHLTCICRVFLFILLIRLILLFIHQWSVYSLFSILIIHFYIIWIQNINFQLNLPLPSSHVVCDLYLTRRTTVWINAYKIPRGQINAFKESVIYPSNF